MKIICIGWNYDDHNREMSRDGRPEAPIFFLKPDTALLRDNKPFFLPDYVARGAGLSLPAHGPSSSRGSAPGFPFRGNSLLRQSDRPRAP